MFTFGQFKPSDFLAPANPIFLISTDISYEYLRFINNSPYQLTVNLSGILYTIPEFYIQDIKIKSSWQGQITITPLATIATVSHAQSNLLTIEGYLPGELPTPTSQAIPQQAVSATASGKPLFSATVGFGPTVNGVQELNIFNPANSGVTYTFHSARIFTSDATTPTANLIFLPGADQNFGTAVPVVSGTGISNPPISTAHATARDVGFSSQAGTDTEVLDMPPNLTQDMLAFPDNKTLAPGGNMYLSLASGAGGHIVRLTLKWAEGNISAPTFVAVGAGGQAIATKLQNDGNPAGTVIAEATPLGQSLSGVFMTNDGNLQLAGKLTVVGASSLDNAAITTNGAGALTIAGVMKALDLMISGGLIGVTNSGDLIDASGSTETILKAIGGDIIFQSPSATEVGRFQNNGILKTAGAMNLNPTGLVDNGSTSGSATLYQLLVGNVKLVIVFQNNFQQGGAAINRALPTPFTASCLIWASGVNGFALLSGGVTQTLKKYTAIGANGFTTSNSTAPGPNTLLDGPGFDTIQYSGGNTGAANGIILIIGV